MSLLRPIFIIICLFSALSGCAGKNLHTDLSWIKLPTHWREAKSASAKAEKPLPISDKWWENFKNPPLTAFIQEAEKANFDIGAAIARVNQADAQLRIAGSSLFPSLDAAGTVSRTREGAARSSIGNTRNITSYSGALNASYELDFWGKNRSAAESARHTADATRFDKETVHLTITSNVATTYFSVISLQDRLSVAKENIANSEKVLNSIRKRFEAGVATSLDVAQQENIVATQKAQLPPLELALRQNSNALAVLLGKMPEALDITKTKQDTLASIAIPTIAPGLPSSLLARRPDVLSAEAQLTAANADIKNARAAFFPSIILTGQAGSSSLALSKLFTPQSMLYAAGSSLTQPIFKGGQLLGQLEYRKARYDELLQNYRKTLVSAFSDVENALAGVRQTAAAAEAQENAARTARTAYTLSQRLFNGGTIDIITLLSTQRSMFSANDALIQAQLTHLQAIVNLYKALGGGWEKEKL